MMEEIYEQLGISREVYEFGEQVLAGLKERFEGIDKNAEYNQMKVIKCHCRTTGWRRCILRLRPGTDTMIPGGRLWRLVYASCFHTEAVLVRPQIQTPSLSALAVAPAANLRPGERIAFAGFGGSPMTRWKRSLESGVPVTEVFAGVRSHLPAGGSAGRRRI